MTAERTPSSARATARFSESTLGPAGKLSASVPARPRPARVSSRVPEVLTNFILIRQLGWINTFAGLIAPTVLFSPFSVFFLRQFFLALPKEIEESARLDGASHFTIFWRLVLPISWPPIATLILLNSILMWNDFFWPFLVGRNSQTRLLTTVLQFFQTQTPNGVPDWTGLMAGSTLASIPVLILLVVLGRRVVQSIQFSGLK